MRLANIPTRAVEVGRIRLGDKSAKNAPRRLTKFRLTSSSVQLLEAVASVYGGQVRPWEGAPTGRNTQHELYAEADQLHVMVPPGDILSQSYELWSNGGCQRRCDGAIRDNDEPCICPIDPDERHALAQKGQACKLTTRLSLWLPKVPGIGVWRLESHGWYAAVELPGAAEILQAATDLGKPLPATLRIAPRVVKRGGETKQFVVPVLDLDISVMDMFAVSAGAPAPAAIEATVRPAIAATSTTEPPPPHPSQLTFAAIKALDADRAAALKTWAAGRPMTFGAIRDDDNWRAHIDAWLEAGPADPAPPSPPAAVIDATSTPTPPPGVDAATGEMSAPPAPDYPPGEEPF